MHALRRLSVRVAMAAACTSMAPTIRCEHLTHIFTPSDANPGGNVHGGTLLKFLESAGWLAGVRHIATAEASEAGGAEALGARSTSAGTVAAKTTLVTARLEHVDFKRPVHIGQLGEAEARVTYTSPHSMRVHVDIYASDAKNPATRVRTNEASLWYVLTDDATGAALPVPPLVVPPGNKVAAAEYEEGRALRDKRLLKRAAALHDAQQAVASWSASSNLPLATSSRSPDGASVELVQVMLPGDTVGFSPRSAVSAGVIAKLMDNAAGICAVKYCRTNVVTACVETVDFLRHTYSGDLVYIRARPTFTSEKSIEVEVLVEVESLTRGQRQPAAHAFFTFVSLDERRKTIPVPPLQRVTEADHIRYLAGQHRYMERKLSRAQALPSPPSGVPLPHPPPSSPGPSTAPTAAQALRE